MLMLLLLDVVGCSLQLWSFRFRAGNVIAIHPATRSEPEEMPRADCHWCKAPWSSKFSKDSVFLTRKGRSFGTALTHARRSSFSWHAFKQRTTICKCKQWWCDNDMCVPPFVLLVIHAISWVMCEWLHWVLRRNMSQLFQGSKWGAFYEAWIGLEAKGPLGIL